MEVVDDVVDNFCVIGEIPKRWWFNKKLFDGNLSFPPNGIVVVNLVVMLIDVVGLVFDVVRSLSDKSSEIE